MKTPLTTLDRHNAAFRKVAKKSESGDRTAMIEQELQTLAGGRIPTLLFTLDRIIWVHGSSSTKAFIGDIYFTDVGLLKVSYSDFSLGFDLGVFAAGVVFFGPLAGAVVSTIMDRSQTKEAFRQYDEKKGEFASLTLTGLYSQRGWSEFIPADEIEGATAIGPGEISLAFRGSELRFSTSKTAEEVETWRSNAYTKRHPLDGGFAGAGLGALLGWAKRANDPVYPWVIEAVNTAKTGNYPPDPEGIHGMGNLVEKLRKLGKGGDAEILFANETSTRTGLTTKGMKWSGSITVVGFLFFWFLSPPEFGFPMAISQGSGFEYIAFTVGGTLLMLGGLAFLYLLINFLEAKSALKRVKRASSEPIPASSNPAK